jgi:hypothetical protein
MTPQEFRQAYLVVQDTLGNDLQSLSSLAGELNSLLERLTNTYEQINRTVEDFVSQQERLQGDREQP